MDPHIPHIYELHDVKISHLDNLVLDVCAGKLINVTEKLDGQNFTFTVKDRCVRFLGKGLPKWAIALGGLNRNQLEQKYADKLYVQSAFLSAYDVLQEIIDTLTDDLLKNVFDNGKFAINSEILVNSNANIVHYRQQAICILNRIEITTGLHRNYDFELHQDLIKLFLNASQHERLKHIWRVEEVPTLSPKSKVDPSQLLRQLKNLVTVFNLSYSKSTIADLLVAQMIPLVKNKFSELPKPLRDGLAQRFGLRKKMNCSKRDFEKIGFKRVWNKVKDFEANRKCILQYQMPFLSFLNKLTDAANIVYPPVFAHIDLESINDIQSQIKLIQKSFDNKSIVASPKLKAEIDMFLFQIDNSTSFQNLEGIVFDFYGRRVKLTGSYAAVNRLLGCFRYGNNPARIQG